MNRKAAKKIREAGIATAELLAEQDIWELQERARVGETLSEKLISNARRLIRKYAAKSGLQVESESDSRLRLKTGLPKLDGYLAGGFEQGSIIEFNGPARSGKSQWCHQLSCHRPIANRGGRTVRKSAVAGHRELVQALVGQSHCLEVRSRPV